MGRPMFSEAGENKRILEMKGLSQLTAFLLSIKCFPSFNVFNTFLIAFY
jgi:hypothetical protein